MPSRLLGLTAHLVFARNDDMYLVSKGPTLSYWAKRGDDSYTVQVCVTARRRHHQCRTTRFWIARREEKALGFGFWLRGATRKGSGFRLYGMKKDLDVVRIALIVYKGALLSVLHVSSSRNKCHLSLAIAGPDH